MPALLNIKFSAVRKCKLWQQYFLVNLMLASSFLRHTVGRWTHCVYQTISPLLNNKQPPAWGLIFYYWSVRGCVTLAENTWSGTKPPPTASNVFYFIVLLSGLVQTALQFCFRLTYTLPPLLLQPSQPPCATSPAPLRAGQPSKQQSAMAIVYPPLSSTL